MSMNAAVHVPYAFMASSAPVSPALSKSAPSPDSSFEFTIPPRLKSIGRQLSQMGETFLPPGTDDSPTSRPTSLARSRTADEVPGMGDEPVLCPFCSKPLPPAIFAAHTNRPGRHGRGSLAMSPVTAPKASPSKLLEPLTVSKAEKIDSSALSIEGMQETVREGDQANIAAAKTILSSAEIEQWAKRAGITLHPPKPAAPEKPIPALAPPPPPANRLSNPPGPGSDSRPSPKFELFSGPSTDADEDHDSESDDGRAGAGAGYSRLTAPGSPTDDEADLPKKRPIHDEPEDIEDIVRPEEPTAAVADVSVELEKEDETKVLLREVLSKFDEMAKSHSSLLASHSSLLTSLKIARSNLSMAEANTEMLEEQLKRGRSGTFSGHPGAGTGSPVTPAASTRQAQTPQTSGAVVPRTVTNPTRGTPSATSASATPARRSEETKRPTSLQIPASASNAAQAQHVSSAGGKDEGKGWKFWNKQQKLGGVTLPSPAQVMAQIPGTPNSERPFDFSQLMPSGQSGVFAMPEATPSAGARGREIPLQRSSTMHTVNGVQRPPGAGTGTTSHVSELARLRAAHASAQTKIEHMSKELGELKKGKVDMEAELESLSQALFEEANKMVAEERRRRAEIEELLKEVREEREALRSTIKVLGGKVEEEAQPTDEEKAKPAEVRDSEEPDFVPRDLDKHYAALRKTIHHVSDGVSLGPGGVPDLTMVSNMPVLEEGQQEDDELAADGGEVEGDIDEEDLARLAASEPNLLGISGGATSAAAAVAAVAAATAAASSLEAELNPWANPFASATSQSSAALPASTPASPFALPAGAQAGAAGDATTVRPSAQGWGQVEDGLRSTPSVAADAATGPDVSEVSEVPDGKDVHDVPDGKVVDDGKDMEDGAEGEVPSTADNVSVKP